MHHDHHSSVSWGTRAAWLAAFVLATLLFSVGLTCAVPLIAFAAICALRQSRRQALLFIGVIWLATELIGFGLLNFPTSAVAFGWAALVGAAILGATWVAGTVAQRVPRAVGMAASFLSAFAAYEGVLWGVSRMIGAAGGAFTTDILAEVFALNAATFAALLLVGALTSRPATDAPGHTAHAHRPSI